MLLLENAAVEVYKVLHPSRRYLSTNEPAVGTNITLPNQCLVACNSFLGMV